MSGAVPGETRIVVGGSGTGIVLVRLEADDAVAGRESVDVASFIERVQAVEAAAVRTRWVWSDTTRYAPLLAAAGARVARSHDLRLCHAILAGSTFVHDPERLRARSRWEQAAPAAEPDGALFTMADDALAPGGPPDDIETVLDEYACQQDAVSSSTAPGRLALLCALESAGALVAAEMTLAGLPWDTAVHDRLLVAELGARPPGGGLPVRVAEAAGRVRALLQDPGAALDSPAKLLRSLHRIGVAAQTTSKWELAQIDHPVIAPLLEYKRLVRLLTANGWTWLSEWVHDGRFRPVYVPAGVVTGRWASSGGGALQIPRRLRPAVRADEGWTLVVADVAQLEPRILAAMSGDRALADAARGRDLYDGVVARGAVSTRAEAKIALLGAMYGATTGESGRLVPRLRRTYPRAMALVDEAARVGEDGDVVTTWLGRSCPAPSQGWHDVQARASGEDAMTADRERARRAAGDRGRFTRNFVVQGTAAEWALAWLAEVRARLAALGAVPTTEAAPRSGVAFSHVPHLAFFLHDELIVHTPVRYADAVAGIVRDAAAAAARGLFGEVPLDFPLDLRVGLTGEKG